MADVELTTWYIAMDGDNAGDAVTEALLGGTEADAVAVSERIKQAYENVKKWVQENGGKVIFEGGDNILFSIDTHDPLETADAVRQLFHDTAQFSATAGAATNMQGAHKALVVGKHTGKDKTVLWNDAAEKIYNDITRLEGPVKEVESTIDDTVEEEAEEEGIVDTDEGDKDKLGPTAYYHYRRLLGSGYDSKTALKAIARLYIYSDRNKPKSKLLGLNEAEKYLIDGEERWKAYWESLDEELPRPGDKVVNAKLFGVVTELKPNYYVVKLSTGSSVHLPYSYTGVSLIRKLGRVANDS